MDPSIPKKYGVALARVLFGSVSKVHCVTSSKKLLPFGENTFSSTKMKMCWLAASGRQRISSVVLA